MKRSASKQKLANEDRGMDVLHAAIEAKMAEWMIPRLDVDEAGAILREEEGIVDDGKGIFAPDPYRNAIDDDPSCMARMWKDGYSEIKMCENRIIGKCMGVHHGELLRFDVCGTCGGRLVWGPEPPFD